MEANTIGEVEPKIDTQELADIVQETARLQERDLASLDPEQARDILRELELPPERLEEARAAIRVRRIQARERARRLKLGAAIALLVMSGIALVSWRAHVKNALLARLSTTQALVTLSGAPLTSPALRSTQPELRFEAIIRQPPQGSSLELTCDWLGPSGQLQRQNHWDTKTIDKAAWPAHCRQRFGAADASGAWSVKMKAGEHTLATGSFVLD